MIQYKHVSLASQVQETIERNILGEKYERGHILSESRLSAELGVSRTPIREALGRIAEEGLIEESQNGMIVIGVSDEDVDDYYEIKALLEADAARRAASRITEEELKELSDIVDQQEFYEQKGDIAKLRDLDTELHLIIYDSCGSRPMNRILKTLHRNLLKYRRSSLEGRNGERVRASIAEHRQIVEALKKHDADLAAARMAEHIDHARINLQKLRNELRTTAEN